MDKDKLKYSILYFAEKYGKDDAYMHLIETTPLPELVKMIILLMFENKFNYYFATNDEYDNYKIIFDYQDELSKKGYVDFN